MLDLDLDLDWDWRDWSFETWFESVELVKVEMR